MISVACISMNKVSERLVRLPREIEPLGGGIGAGQGKCDLSIFLAEMRFLEIMGMTPLAACIELSRQVDGIHHRRKGA
jgi:hypothetical protein